MNNTRRKELAKAIELLAQARDIIEQCKDEEQESFDNLPESFQYGERGEQMEGFIYTLENAYDTIDELEAEIEDEIINA